jgi:AcrR family transcriptional regulator
MIYFRKMVVEMPKIVDEDEVFKAVVTVLMNKGYDNATTAEMAAAANIHEATLFRKYESKARLVILAIENQLSNAPLGKVRYTGRLEEDLNAILQAYIDTIRENGTIIPTMLLEMPRHPELESALEITTSNLQRVANVIKRYQDEGLLRNEPPLLMISILIGPLMVNQMLIQADIDWSITEIDLHDYVEGFLHGRKLN